MKSPCKSSCYRNQIFIYLLLFGSILSCTETDTVSDIAVEARVTPYTDSVRIVWDFGTLTRIYGDTQSFYPRMISADGGDLIAVFESEGAILLTRSTDQGARWSSPVTIAPPNGKVQSTVPEIIQLKNGELLVAYNTRPPQDNSDEELRFGIKTLKSSDGGNTWSSPVTVYEGGFEWTRGVWEPVMIQKKDELLLFFANEHPYSESHDQEISMVRSDNNGESWSDPVTISYRERFRDGMPVPLILDGSEELVIAIEDNGMYGSEFKPAIIGFSSVDDLGETFINGESDQRWSALNKDDQLDGHEYGGAPYLVQIPGGETILSFQSTKGRETGWSQSAMAVAIGDPHARNFSDLSEPFLVDRSKSSLWNSLFVKDDSTITALTSTNAYSDQGLREIYSIDGHLLRDLKIPFEPGIGQLHRKQLHHALEPVITLGAYSPLLVTFYSVFDDSKLYIGYQPETVANERTPLEFEIELKAVSIYLADGSLQSDSAASGTYKFTSDSPGNWKTYAGRNGVWEETKIESDGIVYATPSGGKIHMVEIPHEQFRNPPGKEESWGIHFEVRYTDMNSGAERTEVVPGSHKKIPSTWTKVRFR